MKTTKTTQSRTAKVVLAGLMLAAAPSAQAVSLFPSTDAIVAASKKAAYAVGFLSLVRLLTKKATNKPARYNIDELSAGKNVANNLWYLYDDGLLGQQEKSSVLKANPENDGKLEFTEAAPATGVLGTASQYAKPVAIAFAIMEVLRNKGNLDQLFREYSAKLGTDGGKPFFALVGALAAANAVKSL